MPTPLRIATVSAVTLLLCACQTEGETAGSASSSSLARSSARAVSSVAASVSSRAASSAMTAASSAKPVAAAGASVATLDVPFSPQAPFANWDEIHEETCEEMSLIMVNRYLTGQDLTAQQAEDEVMGLVSWMSAEGYSYDVTVKELGDVAEKKYGLNARVIDDVTIEKIVAELAAGNPVIVPAAGRDLGNPYFSGEGPWYHMLVITGYKKGTFSDSFVTNDPGTKRGAGYEYNTQTLLSAIHDWTGVKEEIRTGAKRVLVLEK